MSEKEPFEKKENPSVENHPAQHTEPFDDGRRRFLGVTAATLAGGALGLEATLATTGNTAHAAELASTDSNQRANMAYQIRLQAAVAERQLGQPVHMTNGDERRYLNRIGNFTKTLPHNAIGEVDPAAYNALLRALSSGRFADVEAVPAGGTGTLLNPLGGLAFNMEGPDSPAVTIVTPPLAIASAGKAAEAIELYWEAYLRDVPFADYAINPAVQEACDDLSRLSDFRGPKQNGRVTPQTLFRYDFPGGIDGPMVSQILYRTFFTDGIEVVPKIRTRQPVLNWNADGSYSFDPLGRDFLTGFDEWLNAQNGVALNNANVFGDNRFIRSVRDLGHVASADNIASIYFRANLILGGLGAVLDGGNPYNNSLRQRGFSTFGGAHLASLIGSAHKGERHAWYHKWNVHRHLRPDAFGGLVDNVKKGRAQYNLHPELLNSPVLEKISAYNLQLNQARFGSNEASYLLPMELPGGSPNHPASPAGHAITAGACVTMLKAWFKEDTVVPERAANGAQITVQPNRDGTGLIPYRYGIDGSPLTIGGELNKLAFNIAEGRNMSGVHWRVSDNITGLYLGEAVAIRILREAVATYPESNARFSLTKFDGTQIAI